MSWSIRSPRRGRGRISWRSSRQLTGGRLHEVDRDDDLSKTFRSILDEFRHRYLVTYTPRDVPKDGWHKLEVRVNRSGARVKARPGYQGG